jgi:SsrA-binding protein
METLAENSRARFDYDIREIYEAGIALKGYEVKSVKGGHMGLAGGYALVRDGEVWLINAAIPPHQPYNTPPDYDPNHARRLLLTKKEIAYLEGALRQKSASLIPLRAHVKHNLVKIELGLGIARKKHDKRELLKKRAASREIRETK